MLRSLTLTATLAAALAAAPVAPAHAWGEKEQNALLGLAVAGTLGALYWKSQQARHAQPDPVYVPAQTYTPRPTVSSSGTSIYATPVASAFNSYTYGERQRIQNRLKGWGYYTGGVDAAFGPGTYSAIAAYARDGNETQRLATTAGAYALLDGLLF